MLSSCFVLVFILLLFLLNLIDKLWKKDGQEPTFYYLSLMISKLWLTHDLVSKACNSVHLVIIWSLWLHLEQFVSIFFCLNQDVCYLLLLRIVIFQGAKRAVFLDQLRQQQTFNHFFISDAFQIQMLFARTYKKIKMITAWCIRPTAAAPTVRSEGFPSRSFF